MAAYNPDGAEPAGTAGRDEGYLYWAAWLGHNGNTVFSAGDGNGFYRRIYFTAGCDQLRQHRQVRVGHGPLNPVAADRHRPHRPGPRRPSAPATVVA